MRKNKNKKNKVRKIKLKKFFINKKIKLFLRYVKTMFIKFFTRKYSIGIIDVLILLVIAGIVSSTTTGYIMNKEYRKNNVGVNGVVYGDSLEKFISDDDNSKFLSFLPVKFIFLFPLLISNKVSFETKLLSTPFTVVLGKDFDEK